MPLTNFKWKLPSSPDAREYRELVAMVDELKRGKDAKLGMAWFAAVAETDFWFWQKYIMSLGKLEIDDPGHRHFGRLWVDEPWFFDRMREVQEDFDSGRTDVFYQWARFHFKSSAIQKGGILWFLAKDRTETCLVYTHRADKTGAAFGKDFQKEIINNPRLQAHWPQFRNLQECSAMQIVVDRPPGIREPSIVIYGIMSSAASGHFTKIFVDDGVDPEERSPLVLAEIDTRLSLMTFVQSSNTQRFWIGVPACEEDPIEKRRKKGGFFTLVRRQPGIEPGGKYPLHSKKFFDDWKRTAREDHFASQVLLEIVPPGMRFFREEWLRPYTLSPEQAARGCRIHIIVDPAEGKKLGKRKSDLLVIRVVGFTYDRRRRNLDLWRERVGIVEATDLLFGVLRGDEKDPDNAWKMTAATSYGRGLVRRWQRFDPYLTVWVENVGGSQFDKTLTQDMKHRRRQDSTSPVCQIRELRSNVPKEERIANLQPHYRQGDIEYPAGGFGHGSFTTEDLRDTMEQFKEDELRQWTLSGDILHDDMLDCEAWPSQPGARFGYPDESEEHRRDPLLAKLDTAGEYGDGEDYWSRASWRVA